MAKFNFYLKDNLSTKETPIYLFIRYQIGKKTQTIKFSTGETILPKNWNNETKQPRKFDGVNELISRLDNFESRAKNYFRRFQNDNDSKLPDTDELKEILNKEFRQIEAIPTIEKLDFFPYIESFIKERENSINIQTGKKFSSIQVRYYKVILKKLREYMKKKRIKKFGFEDVTLDFYLDYVEYLRKENYSTNYIGNHIKIIKTFMSSARERGLHNSMDYTKKRFKKTNELTDKIYLTIDELRQIENIDLSNNPRLDNARDWLIVGAWTGLRFSDFTAILPSEINIDTSEGDYIEIETQKTGKTVVIPILPQVKKILQKYHGITPNGLPRPITNQKFNDYVKEVGKLAQIDEIVSLSITKGGLVVSNSIPKYEAMSSHCCRRSFATNAYHLGVPTLTIRAITGHNSEKAFLLYIRATPKEHANKMREIMMKSFEPNLKVA